MFWVTEISAPEVGRVRESYANQTMVESVLGQPDGEIRDASGNLVGGMFLSPASKLREIAEDVIAESAIGNMAPQPKAGTRLGRNFDDPRNTSPRRVARLLR